MAAMYPSDKEPGIGDEELAVDVENREEQIAMLRPASMNGLSDGRSATFTADSSMCEPER